MRAVADPDASYEILRSFAVETKHRVREIGTKFTVVAIKTTEAVDALVAEFHLPARKMVHAIPGFKRKVTEVHLLIVNERTCHVTIAVARAMDGIVTVLTLCVIDRKPRHCNLHFCELFKERFIPINLTAISNRIELIAPEARLAKHGNVFVR